ncbi:Protein argonaute 4B [Acorus gramineus]|uniref:Protein argonaute 4B n=1 Tax=Acorus gramineus TaxID=55184 RepID=A0AAV9BVA7_ACOGR|nr:Protein argonaute 4B [Acorus gramineus]
MGQFMKFDDLSETSSGHGGVTSAGNVPVPELPRLHEKVSSSMFFCPPPPMVPPPNNAAQSVKSKRVPMLRPGYGSAGRPIDLLSNHFKASFTDMGLKTHFFRYNVLIRFENGRPVEGRGILGRKVLEKVWETYSEKLLRKPFVFDGVNGLYTVGPLPQNRLCFTVGLPAHHSNKWAH